MTAEEAESLNAGRFPDTWAALIGDTYFVGLGPDVGGRLSWLNFKGKGDTWEAAFWDATRREVVDGHK